MKSGFNNIKVTSAKSETYVHHQYNLVVLVLYDVLYVQPSTESKTGLERNMSKTPPR